MGDISDYVNSGLEMSKPTCTDKTAPPASVYLNVAECPKCGGTMRKKLGAHGAFWGCDGFPSCDGSRGVLR